MNTEEIMENTTEVEEGAPQSYTSVESGENIEILVNIYNDVHLILVLSLVTFFLSCLRGWRRNTIKGGK